MNYRRSYYSSQGHASELAYAFRRIFPSQTPVVDLSVETTLACDVHLIDFEYQEPTFDKTPQQIQAFLSNLEYRDIRCLQPVLYAQTKISECRFKKAWFPFCPNIPGRCKCF